jgi:AMMECR1 domain-containing protein
MAEISAEQGAYLVQLARKAIEGYFANGRKVSPDRSGGILSEKRGCSSPWSHTPPASCAAA